MTLQNINNLANIQWEKFILLFPQLHIFSCPIVMLSNRLTCTAGYCVQEQNKIVLSTKYLAKFKGEMLNVVLPHELAHQVDHNIFPNGALEFKHGHGRTWQIIMVEYGLAPDPYHSMGKPFSRNKSK